LSKNRLNISRAAAERVMALAEAHLSKSSITLDALQLAFATQVGLELGAARDRR
jgi:hypothetical protein